MKDREIVAAIAAGDPAGLAGAYDKYAEPLHGYCGWMLSERAVTMLTNGSRLLCTTHRR